MSILWANEAAEHMISSYERARASERAFRQNSPCNGASALQSKFQTETNLTVQVSVRFDFDRSVVLVYAVKLTAGCIFCLTSYSEDLTRTSPGCQDWRDTDFNKTTELCSFTVIGRPELRQCYFVTRDNLPRWDEVKVGCRLWCATYFAISSPSCGFPAAAFVEVGLLSELVSSSRCFIVDTEY